MTVFQTICAFVGFWVLAACLLSAVWQLVRWTGRHIRAPWLRKLAFYLGLVECPHLGHPIVDCPDDLAWSALNLRAAVADLYDFIGDDGMDCLRPETVATAQAVRNSTPARPS